ncbi:MAG: hypothetical protein RR891_06540 [Clostridium sp.]|uniref:lysine 5,6-aminomutase reactivase ATPase KamC n=1 Tax=Clostridium sp. TaxID=1506 RepID=UPI0030294C8A
MKFLDNEQRAQIGFSFIMDELGIITSYGTEEKKLIKPYKTNQTKELIEELDNIDCMISHMNQYNDKFYDIVRLFHKIKDIRNTLKRTEKVETLDEVELYEIKYVAMLLEELKLMLEGIDLSIDKIKLHSLNEVIDILDPSGKRISTFYIYDEYSEKLSEIRGLKNRKEKEIYSCDDENLLEKLKQERLDIVIREEEEELHIRKELTSKLSSFSKKISENLKVVGVLDLLMAKASVAIKHNCVKPTIVEKMDIKIVDGINPEVEAVLKKKGKAFSPVTIELEGGTTVITGANMGGKSVALKTIVLNLFLGQMGFFAFAKEATYPILDFVHFVSDDMQSISKGLSTFGAEIIKLKEVVECVKRGNGFVALDEFARGTNPKEGYYLVKSLAHYLQRFSTSSIISTHYDGVVEEPMVHYQVVGLKNIDFNKLKFKIDLNKKNSVEIIQENMEYKLEKVSKENKVPKDALNIAMLLGLENDIINIAKTYYEEDNNGK